MLLSRKSFNLDKFAADQAELQMKITDTACRDLAIIHDKDIYLENGTE
jgi:hypothetical protein